MKDMYKFMHKYGKTIWAIFQFGQFSDENWPFGKANLTF